MSRLEPLLFFEILTKNLSQLLKVNKGESCSIVITKDSKQHWKARVPAVSCARVI